MPDLDLHAISNDLRAFPPIGRSETADFGRINFDGVLKLLRPHSTTNQMRAYTLLFRNGILESVTGRMVGQRQGETTTSVGNFEDSLIRYVVGRLGDLVNAGIEPPYAILITLGGVAGARYSFNRAGSPHDFDSLYGDQYDRDEYHFDEVIVDTLPSDLAECAAMLRPLLDQIANAAGRASSPIFDAQGQYIAPPDGG